MQIGKKQTWQRANANFILVKYAPQSTERNLHWIEKSSASRPSLPLKGEKVVLGALKFPHNRGDRGVQRVCDAKQVGYTRWARKASLIITEGCFPFGSNCPGFVDHEHPIIRAMIAILPDDPFQTLTLAGFLVARAADGEFGVAAATLASVRAQIPEAGHAPVAFLPGYARFAATLTGSVGALSAERGLAAFARRATGFTYVEAPGKCQEFIHCCDCHSWYRVSQTWRKSPLKRPLLKLSSRLIGHFSQSPNHMEHNCH